MNNEQIHRDIGRVEGEVKALRRDITEMKTQLATACAYIEQHKGSKRATYAIAGGIGAFVGALSSLAVAWFK